jgi:hypothetical protein
MTEKLDHTENGTFFRYECDDAKHWYRTQASIMADYDIINLRLETTFEVIMYMRVLPCPEVNKIYITYVKGVYITKTNYMDPMTFDLNYLKTILNQKVAADDDIPLTYADTSFMAEIERAIHALFCPEWRIALFEAHDFNKTKEQFLVKNLFYIKHSAARPLHQSVTSCIWEYCKPVWYDFDYDKQPPITMRVWIGVCVYDDVYVDL